jgi:hypothetical protein
MKKKLLFILLGCSLFSTAKAQTFPYTLTTYQEPYVPLSEALTLTPSTDPNWDDPDLGFYEIPIGFDFNLMDHVDDTLALIDPGCQLVLGFNDPTLAVISPFFADVRNASDSIVVSSIKYATEGNPGSRIFKIEWSNVGFFNEYDATGEFNMTSNYQVWFYEGTQDMDFRYGPNTINDGTLIYDQWGTPLIFLIEDFYAQTQAMEGAWSLQGDPLNPVADTVNLMGIPGLEDILLSEPNDGTVYHFDTGLVTVDESGANEIKFEVFPTLAESNVLIYWDGQRNTSLSVYDANGKMMEQRNLTYGNTILDISSWSSGNYYFTIGEGPALHTKKVFKK